MKMSGYTMQERTLIVYARIMAVVFLLTAVAIGVAPDYILNYMTNVGRGLFGFYSPEAILAGERFWLVPNISLFVALSYSCLLVQKNPPQYIEHVHILLLVTFVAMAGYAACFYLHGPYFFYIAGACIHFVLFVVTLVIYKRAVRSRNRWSA